jgi:hypothetical protein
MTLVVSCKHSTTPNGVPTSCNVVRIQSESARVSDVKMIIQGKYPLWYNLQIVGIQKA